MDADGYRRGRPSCFRCALGKLFRRLFLTRLVALHDAGRLAFFGPMAHLAERRAFLRHLSAVGRKRWVVSAKAPFVGPEAVLAYLSRYTYRVAISNSRLIAVDESGVTFRYKDYRRDGADRQQVMPLATDEFSRGTGILNNESYIGRMVWNKRNYLKNPETERRTARVNDASEWVLTDVPEMRIVSDELWQRVKERQKEIGELFDFGQSNRLNATHRPGYLLSHLLECAECGGPYAISGKDRYSCTNRKKRLPIDELDGACCGNSKTITRQELEQRVLDCLPVAFFSLGMFDTMSAKIIEHETAKLRRPETEREQMKRELNELERKQKNFIQQISDRALQGRPPLPALDDTLDQLELQRIALAKEIAAFTTSEPDMRAKIEELKRRHDPAQTELRMRHFFLQARRGKNDDAKRQVMPIVRSLVQKVVIGKTPGHQPATLEVHGLIASILAQMDVLDFMERRFVAKVHADFIEKLEAGEIDTQQKQKKLLDAYEEELRARYPEWANLQVSVVAGRDLNLTKRTGACSKILLCEKDCSHIPTVDQTALFFRLVSIPVVDLGHTKSSVNPLALDDDINRERQHFANVVPFEVATAFRLLDEQRQLLEGEARGVGMDCGNRAGMPGVHVADIIECRSVAKLLQQYPVRPHAQTGFEKVLGIDFCRSLATFRIEEPDMIGLWDHQLRRILDGDDPLGIRDIADKRLG